MRGQAQRMTRLIEDLLSLSRIEMRAHMAPQTPVELQPILVNMVETLTPLARERGVEIRLDLPESRCRCRATGTSCCGSWTTSSRMP
jgi:two-component system phosphate regulon sensor histidine kinase PhoR